MSLLEQCCTETCEHAFLCTGKDTKDRYQTGKLLDHQICASPLRYSKLPLKENIPIYNPSAGKGFLFFYTFINEI